MKNENVRLYFPDQKEGRKNHWGARKNSDKLKRRLVWEERSSGERGKISGGICHRRSYAGRRTIDKKMDSKLV